MSALYTSSFKSSLKLPVMPLSGKLANLILKTLSIIGTIPDHHVLISIIPAYVCEILNRRGIRSLRRD